MVARQGIALTDMARNTYHARPDLHSARFYLILLDCHQFTSQARLNIKWIGLSETIYGGLYSLEVIIILKRKCFERV